MDIVALSPLIMISRCFALWCWVVVVVYLSANIHANKVVCKTFFIYSKIWKEKSSEGCCNGRCRSKDGVFWGKYNEHIKYDCIFNRILKDSVARHKEMRLQQGNTICFWPMVTRFLWTLSSFICFQTSDIHAFPKPDSVWKETVIIFKFVENNRFQNVEQPYKTVNNQFLRISMIFVFYYFTYNITCT